MGRLGGISQTHRYQNAGTVKGPVPFDGCVFLDKYFILIMTSLEIPGRVEPLVLRLKELEIEPQSYETQSYELSLF